MPDIKAPSWKLLIGGVLAVTLVLVAMLAVKLGALEDVAIERKNSGPYFVVSKDHIGAYHKIAGVITEVEQWSKALGDPCTLSFGEYFDNPETTDEDRMRSRGGCIASPGNDSYKNAAQTGNLPAGYSTSSIDARDSVVATFTGAPSIGPMKVYPKVMEYLKTNGLSLAGPVIEIYEITGPASGRTQYVFPVR